MCAPTPLALGVPVWELPAESVEWIGPITITRDGLPYLGAWEVAVVRKGLRATTYTTPDTSGPDSGVLVGPGTDYELNPGRYHIWVQIAPVGGEAPVFDNVGELRIT